ncbi:TPM domain-containing protein [Ancylobacter terrae]|uniref:TPM domain-containing protein n=1 Tax=Ancylobacter sp. sgz301288 TaxID=3342077 RepID=UPI00385C97E3
MAMRARLASLAIVLLLAVTARPALAELSFPPLTGRVVDAAGVLDPATRAALEAKLAGQETRTTDQLVVATVPSLQGTSVEDYANRLFRAWKLGQTDKDNGVLLLVAPTERRVRIEVGYGLEGVLPDAVASTIVQTAILPEFRKGDFAGGVVKGADAVMEILNLDPEEAKLRARRAAEPEGPPDDWILFIIFVVMILYFIHAIYRSARFGSTPAGRRGRVAQGGISTWGGSRSSSSGGSWSSGGGGFSGGGGSSGGGGASGSW